MPRVVNPVMVSAGYARAVDVARVICKSLPTIHRMVEDGRFEGTHDGDALYVKIDSVVAFFIGEGNEPLAAAARALRRSA